ncbi:hypothetical protein GJ496_004420 [Pomphorhynchus laevis]|nr:hypothetical protein GJ496_004420 [Pomphorhynchus laevis]
MCTGCSAPNCSNLSSISQSCLQTSKTEHLQHPTDMTLQKRIANGSFLKRECNHLIDLIVFIVNENKNSNTKSIFIYSTQQLSRGNSQSTGTANGQNENGTPEHDDSNCNFWQINNYRHVVKRVEEGYRRCNDLISFLLERAECEKNFARQLRTWARRWSDQLSDKRGLEYGTANKSWSAFITESDKTADMHVGIADNLKIVANQLKGWQRENYIKTVLYNKTVKEFEDDFKKAQKPWSKAHARLQKAKRNFHSACRALSTAESIKTATEVDASLTAENKKKSADRFEKANREKEAAEYKYRACLDELVEIMPSYKENMLQVFNRSQSFEKDRLQFFKDIFRSAHKSLDTSSRNDIIQTYSELLGYVEAMDSHTDITMWSQQYGANAPIVLPEFEECPVEMAANSSNLSANYAHENKSFSDTLSKQTISEEAECSTPSHSVNGEINNNASCITRPIGFIDRTICGNVDNAVSSNQFIPTDDGQPVFILPKNSEYPEVCNPFHIPLPERSAPSLTCNANSDTRKCVEIPVRALYKYEAQEEDELTLKEGMIFTMIAEEDEQGWSKGRYKGKEGLYPATYAEPIPDDSQ